MSIWVVFGVLVGGIAVIIAGSLVAWRYQDYKLVKQIKEAHEKQDRLADKVIAQKRKELDDFEEKCRRMQKEGE